MDDKLIASRGSYKLGNGDQITRYDTNFVDDINDCISVYWSDKFQAYSDGGYTIWEITYGGPLGLYDEQLARKIVDQALSNYSGAKLVGKELQSDHLEDLIQIIIALYSYIVVWRGYDNDK